MTNEQSNDRSYRTLAIEYAREYYSICRMLGGLIPMCAVIISGAFLPAFIGAYVELGLLPWETLYVILTDPAAEQRPELSSKWIYVAYLWWTLAGIGVVAALEMRNEND